MKVERAKDDKIQGNLEELPESIQEKDGEDCVSSNDTSGTGSSFPYEVSGESFTRESTHSFYSGSSLQASLENFHLSPTIYRNCYSCDGSSSKSAGNNIDSGYVAHANNNSYSSDYSDTYIPRVQSVRNFQKKQEIRTHIREVPSYNSLSSFVSAAKNSRYFQYGEYSEGKQLTNDEKYICELEDPFYYFEPQKNMKLNRSAFRLYPRPKFEIQGSSSGTSGSRSGSSSSSNNKFSGEASQQSNIKLSVIYSQNRVSKNNINNKQEFEENTIEDGDDDLEGQFVDDVTVFKTTRDYFNMKLYYHHFNIGSIISVFLLLGIIVLGSWGFTFFQISKTVKTAPPVMIEILSKYKYPTLSAIRTALVDPDTPKEFYLKKNIDGEDWKLVFSDEFNAEGRTFYEGDDPFWTAVDLHYAATSDLEYYLPDMITTSNGSLQIKIDAFPTNGLQYRSGMLQSWNKMCFNEHVIFEVSAKLPGYSTSRGLWPAIWTLGNLARAGYQASTDGVWPYTYNECDSGITPNQSSPDGLSFLPGQRLSSCTCFGEDHPNIGTGRGAPEIDVLEGNHDAKAEWALGMQTLQIAPFDPWYVPDYRFMTIYDSNLTSMNEHTGSPTQEAIASQTVLNETWFSTVRDDDDHNIILPLKTNFQQYAMEYDSVKRNHDDSYLQFYVGNEPSMGIKGSSLHPEGNVGWRQITKEPMSIVLNLAISPTWSLIDFPSLKFPAVLEIDYIRIYQREGMESLTCNPPDYPTSNYINSHLNAYMNNNLTTWEAAGYAYPKNSLMHGCKAKVPIST